jgi:hypothetical protein
MFQSLVNNVTNIYKRENFWKWSLFACRCIRDVTAFSYTDSDRRFGAAHVGTIRLHGITSEKSTSHRHHRKELKHRFSVKILFCK